MSVMYCEECHEYIDTDFRFCDHMERDMAIETLIHTEGVRLDTKSDPPMIYIPWDMPVNDDMAYLREEGFVIQTEII